MAGSWNPKSWLHSCLFVGHLHLRPGAAQGNPSCWSGMYSYSSCCHSSFGPTGNNACWDDSHTYESCCDPVGECLQTWSGAAASYGGSGDSNAIILSAIYPRLSGIPLPFWQLGPRQQRGEAELCRHNSGRFFQATIKLAVAEGERSVSYPVPVPLPSVFGLCAPASCSSGTVEKHLVPQYLQSFFSFTALPLQLQRVELREMHGDGTELLAWQCVDATADPPFDTISLPFMVVLAAIGIPLILQAYGCGCRHSHAPALNSDHQKVAKRELTPDILRVSCTVAIMFSHILRMPASQHPGFEMLGFRAVVSQQLQFVYTMLDNQADVFFLLSMYLLAAAHAEIAEGGLAVVARKLAQKVLRQLPLLILVEFFLERVEPCLPSRADAPPWVHVPEDFIRGPAGKDAETILSCTVQRALFMRYDSGWPFGVDLVCWLVAAVGLCLPPLFFLGYEVAVFGVIALRWCADAGVPRHWVFYHKDLIMHRLPMSQLYLLAALLVKSMPMPRCPRILFALLITPLFVSALLFTAAVDVSILTPRSWLHTKLWQNLWDGSPLGPPARILAEFPLVLTGVLLLARGNNTTESEQAITMPHWMTMMIRRASQLSFAVLAVHQISHRLVWRLLDVPPLPHDMPLVAVLVAPAVVFWAFLSAWPAHLALCEWPSTLLEPLLRHPQASVPLKALLLCYCIGAIYCIRQRWPFFPVAAG